MKKRVLIADDSPQVRTLLEGILSKDYDVVSVGDGWEALQWLQHGNMPDIIISDIMMPDTDGWGLLKNLRESIYFREVPVIMLSALEKSEERIKCLEMGANDYMVKPFNPKELKIRICNLINHYSNARS